MAALLFLICLAQVFAYIKEGDLYELVGEKILEFGTDFHDQLRVINLYAPLSSEYTKSSSAYFFAAKELAKEHKNIKLAKIDITNPKNRDFIPQLKIDRYPGIVYYPAELDDYYTYLGPKTQLDFITAFEEKAWPMREFQDTTELDKYLLSQIGLHGLLLGVFQEFEGEKYEFFRNFAKKNIHRYRFGIVKDKGEWFDKFGIDQEAILIIRAQLLMTPKDQGALANYKFEDYAKVLD